MRDVVTLGEADGPGALMEFPTDVGQDRAGRYWVLQWSEPPDGLRLYDTIVEVIDPATRTLLATARLERVQVIASLDNGRVALHAADDVGVPQVRIVEVELVR